MCHPADNIAFGIAAALDKAVRHVDRHGGGRPAVVDATGTLYRVSACPAQNNRAANNQVVASTPIQRRHARTAQRVIKISADEHLYSVELIPIRIAAVPDQTRPAKCK